MTIEHVEVLVEESSAEAALEVLLPKLLGAVTFQIHAHQGKPHLLRHLPGRLRGYSYNLPPSWRVAVLIDQDDEQCERLKANLEQVASSVGLRTRSGPARDGKWEVVNRIAVEELEAWFFGDWDAVAQAYPRVSRRVPSRTRYSDPDSIPYTWEALERELQQAGYFAAGLPKMTVARAIAEHMDPARNRSHSFQVFRSALQQLVET